MHRLSGLERLTAGRAPRLNWCRPPHAVPPTSSRGLGAPFPASPSRSAVGWPARLPWRWQPQGNHRCWGRRSLPALPSIAHCARRCANRPASPDATHRSLAEGDQVALSRRCGKLALVELIKATLQLLPGFGRRRAYGGKRDVLGRAEAHAAFASGRRAVVAEQPGPAAGLDAEPRIAAVPVQPGLAASPPKLSAG